MTKPARIDHSACTHPRTFAGRSECRAARRAATIPETKAVTKATATKTPAATKKTAATKKATAPAAKKAVPTKTTTAPAATPTPAADQGAA